MEDWNNFISLKIVGLDCNALCQKVQALVDKYVKSGKIVDDSFLIIKVSNVSCTIDPELKKIENVNITES